MKNIHHYFSNIAHKYRDIRTTDIEPILFIKKKLPKLQNIKAADIGCGEGRYALKLFEYLGDRLCLYCIDSNKGMLGQLNTYLTQHKIKNFQVKVALARSLPIKNNTLDCIFSFNAIHHFQFQSFLNEAERVLKDNCYLFIYTRLRNQNSKNIWGKYFPLFIQKETRLYELNELEAILEKVPKLKLDSIEVFEYKRISTMDQLIRRAENHCYSTFYLYTQEEFKQSLVKFKQNIREHFEDLENITWIDENILLVVRKQC